MVRASTFSRIANLWATGPQATDYDKWSRYGLLVMSGGTQDEWRRFAREVKARNPRIVLLGSEQFVNVGPPSATPWMKEEWYLRRPSGEKVNWWAGQVYAPNLLLDDCLNALVEQTARNYGELLKGRVIDGLFYDSVVGAVTWYGEVDTNRDGKADEPSEVNPRWIKRQCLFLDRLRQRWPGVVIVANDVESGHMAHVNGRLFEGATLLDRAADGTRPVKAVVEELNFWMTKSVQPAATFALMTHPLGWQGWRVGKGDKVTTAGEVDRVRRDFRRMRLGLAIALMTEAYYAYDIGTVWYGLPFWYAEYEAKLGKALGPAKEVFDVPPRPILEWKAGQDVGAFQLGSGVRSMPEGIMAEEKDAGAPWRCIVSTAPQTVRLEPGKTYRIEANCRVLTKPTGAFQFTVRTGKGGWQEHDKGVVVNYGPSGTPWRIIAEVVPDDFDDYAVQWHHLGAGAMRLESLSVRLIRQSYWLREFEGGAVVLNPARQPMNVKLGRRMRRLLDPEAPRHLIEVDDGGTDFACQGAWELKNGERHYCGSTFRSAAKPGDTARWSFSAPSDDTFAIFACAPGGNDLTDAAMYDMDGVPAKPIATINQQGADGGWVKLFDVKLSAGHRYAVRLRSGGTGATAADAVRLESAARYNDGGVVDAITLDALDGLVLVNTKP
jgi:hypothetical protein